MTFTYLKNTTNIFFTKIKNQSFNLLLFLQLNFFLIFNFFQCENFNEKKEKSVNKLSTIKNDIINFSYFNNIGTTKQISIPFFQEKVCTTEDISDGYKDSLYSFKKGLETIKDYSLFNKYYNEQYESIISSEKNKELVNIIRYDEWVSVKDDYVNCINNNELLKVSEFNFNSLINNSVFNVLDGSFTWNLLFVWSISSILFLFLFKWAAWPTYNWAIFIYNISNTGAAGFLSFSMKFIYGILILILNVYLLNYLDIFWSILLICISIFSSLFAVLGAINERFIKKFLLYSSLGHVSFMLLGFIYFLNGGFDYLFLYLIVYTLMSNISWLFLVSSLQNIKLLNSFINSLNNDFMAKTVLALILFSLSGLPPFSGFFVKFEMLLLSIYSSDYILAIILLLLSLITLFYYIRIIKILFFDKFELKKNLEVKENIVTLLISFSFITVIFFIVFFDYTMIYYIKNFISSSF